MESKPNKFTMIIMEETKKILAPPVKKDKEIEMKKMEIETVNRVISDPDLKTEFTQKERILISLLEDLAKSPFTISEGLAKEMGLKFNMEKYQFSPLTELVKGYTRKGKALKRKGIGEDVDIVRAYFTSQIEQAKASQKTNPLLK